MFLLFHDSERLGRQFRLFHDLGKAQDAFLEIVEPGKKTTRVSRAQARERMMPRYASLGEKQEWRHWESVPSNDTGGEETVLEPIEFEDAT